MIYSLLHGRMTVAFEKIPGSYSNQQPNLLSSNVKRITAVEDSRVYRYHTSGSMQHWRLSNDSDVRAQGTAFGVQVRNNLNRRDDKAAEIEVAWRMCRELAS